MSIRPLTPADVPALAASLATLPLLIRYGRTADAQARDWHDALTRGDTLLVHDDGSGPAGLAWFVPGGTLAVGGYLRLIAVRPDAQRRGIGAALLAAFEAGVRATSRHAFLLVSDFNTEAQRFYERHGYGRVGVLPGLIRADVGEVLFWKTLG